ncbi:hypothetical protein CGLAUT_00060 [Corynebacterium glaucum]|uniref:hypothetical protein n=1 Tax=Corynebacterium glaucum TaxID=187491 RepID=UPI0025B44687|nr:hypothetical protein [Corynebacterium glaucum]WJZ06541.1 hypothetical protein CGLAUT_00060 [Corynebacterium glaucum]
MKRSLTPATRMKTAAAATAVTVVLATGTVAAVAAVTIAPAASAQTAALELSSALSSTRGSSDRDYRLDPDNPGVDVPKQTPLGSAYTGIAPISLALALAAAAAALQVIVDATPPLRQAVDNAAAQFGLSQVAGSSEGNRIIDVDRVLALINAPH